MTQPKILVIDDNKMDFCLVEHGLKGKFEVVHATSCVQGLEACRRSTPDCVLLDQNLPDGQGVDLLHHFAEFDIPVIMITGHGDESLVVQAMKAGALDYLPKKKLREHLLETVTKAVKLSQRNRALQGSLHQSIIITQALSRLIPGTLLTLNLNTRLLRAVQPHGDHAPPAFLEATKLGCHLQERSPDTFTQRLLACATELQVEGESVRHFEFEEDGRRYSAHVARCGPERVLVSIQDIGSSLDTLQHHTRLASLGQLTSSIVHDTNNALMGIICYADLLISRVEEPEIKEDLGELRTNTASLREFMRVLLDYSRDQAPTQEVFDLNTLILEFAPLLRQVVQPPAQLMIRLPSETCPVRASPLEAKQVLLNLVMNAHSALPESGGRIVISTERVQAPGEPRGRVALKVSDTGCGIPEELHATIFEPFFTTKGQQGTGLGMATVQRVITQSGGEVQVTSEVGVGTTFTILLPLDTDTS